MTENRKQIGFNGELVARAHLERLGWVVLVSNYRCKTGEMDLIAEERAETGSTLVFVEVKTRRGRAHGSPIESVDWRKQERLAAIALAYLAERNAGGEEPACRFDVAEVFLGADGLSEVRLHRGVFSR